MDFLRQLYRNLSDIEGLIYTRAQASEIRIIIEQIEDETQALKAQTLRLKDQLSSKSDECQSLQSRLELYEHEASIQLHQAQKLGYTEKRKDGFLIDRVKRSLEWENDKLQRLQEASSAQRQEQETDIDANQRITGMLAPPSPPALTTAGTPTATSVPPESETAGQPPRQADSEKTVSPTPETSTTALPLSFDPSLPAAAPRVKLPPIPTSPPSRNETTVCLTPETISTKLPLDLEGLQTPRIKLPPATTAQLKREAAETFLERRRLDVLDRVAYTERRRVRRAEKRAKERLRVRERRELGSEAESDEEVVDEEEEEEGKEESEEEGGVRL